MSITRTEAHKIFSDLYRKQRSPEHQQLIDEAISKSNDVFIRIDLMQKVDEDFQNKNRKVELDSKSKKPENKPSREEKYKKIEEVAPKRESSPQPQQSSSQESKEKETPKEDKSKDKKLTKKKPEKTGLLTGFFGGNNEIIQFAKDTGAIELGLFGRNPTISPTVEKVFRSLKEDQIISAIQVLKVCESQGWRAWTPLVYNIINNFSKFFNAFVSLDTLFLERISPEVFLDKSTKLQLSYIRVLEKEETKDIINEYVPNLIRQDDKLASKLPQAMAGINYALSLETTKPKLSESIAAFYIVANNKMIDWDHIKGMLNVPPMPTAKFQTSPEITREIELSINKNADDINNRIHKLEDLKNLKKRYFTIDDNGKISFDFLTKLVDDIFAHQMPENMQSQSIKQSYRSNPHKLLFLILRDFQTCYFPILEGYIKVGDSGMGTDTILIQPGLFRAEIENMNTALRALDAFNRKYPTFNYSFQSFYNDHAKGTSDPIVNGMLQVVNQCASILSHLANKINIIVDNHELALDYKKQNKLHDRVEANKDKVIDEIKVMHRFIPYYDQMIHTRDRLNGKKIYEVFMQMTKLLYNYSVIFKDNYITQKFTTNKKLETELEKLKAEYKRLTNIDYVYQKHDYEEEEFDAKENQTKNKPSEEVISDSNI
jgi:hypothetical protein